MSATVDPAALIAAVNDFARARCEELRDRFIDVTQQMAPRRTGALADSVQGSDVTESGRGFSCRVWIEAEYATWVNDGTGIYGPEGRPIVPVSASVLVFDWPAAGGIVFTRRVMGSEPTHFWNRAVEAWPQVVNG